MNPLPCILTIAGSDSGGGAGIQADLKTISMLGAYGASVITALTAQNTTAVTAIHAPQPVFVAEQMKAVISDFDVRAAKTGMLFSAPIIKRWRRFLRPRPFRWWSTLSVSRRAVQSCLRMRLSRRWSSWCSPTRPF